MNPTQLKTALWGLLLIFIISSCDKKEIPEACFTFESVDTIDGGIQFTNCSMHASSYSWIANNNYFSSAEHPILKTELNFPIEISLLATNDYGTDTLIQTVTEENLELKPKADFKYTINLENGLLVNFENTSINATGFKWDFGDGDISTENNPLHIYKEEKIYDIKLEATTSTSNNTITKPINVKDTLHIDVSFYLIHNEHNLLQYNFFNKSKNTTDYLWDFGDGTTSTEREPVHIFPDYGEYEVKLTASNQFYKKTISQLINIISPEYAVIAYFEFEIDKSDSLLYHFINKSINATSFRWGFDGFETTEENPTYRFSSEKVCHSVFLEASNNDLNDFYFYDFPEGCGLVGKPNIYLYPEHPTQLEITIDFPKGGDIVTSVPEYGHGWNVYVEPSGLIDRTYTYLFYESVQPTNYQSSKGWCIAKENLEAFFVQNLNLYGFNATETNDFIKYWIPRLTFADYFLIYPQTNSIIDKVIELNISTQPDNILRLFYDIKGCSEKVELSAPTIQTFNRTGFVVSEWGVTLE